MRVAVNIQKKHLISFLVCLSVLLGAFMVSAFGGSSPAVLGHSAGELIVDGSSVVDDSLAAADINSVSLAAECSTITGGAGLCDGSDADTDTDQQQLGTSGSSITLTNSPSIIAPDLSCTNCIGGTEIDESTLGTVNYATFAALCQNLGSSSNADICMDIPGGNVCSKDSCADGACDGCVSGGPFDMILTCSSGQIERLNRVSAAAC